MAFEVAVGITVVGFLAIIALLLILARYLGLWSRAASYLRASKEEKAQLCRAERPISGKSYLFENDLDWIGLWPRSGSYKRFTNLDDANASNDDSVYGFGPQSQGPPIPPQPLRPAPGAPPVFRAYDERTTFGCFGRGSHASPDTARMRVHPSDMRMLRNESKNVYSDEYEYMRSSQRSTNPFREPWIQESHNVPRVGIDVVSPVVKGSSHQYIYPSSTLSSNSVEQPSSFNVRKSPDFYYTDDYRKSYIYNGRYQNHRRSSLADYDYQRNERPYYQISPQHNEYSPRSKESRYHVHVPEASEILQRISDTLHRHNEDERRSRFPKYQPFIYGRYGSASSEPTLNTRDNYYYTNPFRTSLRDYEELSTITEPPDHEHLSYKYYKNYDNQLHNLDYSSSIRESEGHNKNKFGPFSFSLQSDLENYKEIFQSQFHKYLRRHQEKEEHTSLDNQPNYEQYINYEESNNEIENKTNITNITSYDTYNSYMINSSDLHFQLQEDEREETNGNLMMSGYCSKKSDRWLSSVETSLDIPATPPNTASYMQKDTQARHATPELLKSSLRNLERANDQQTKDKGDLNVPDKISVGSTSSEEVAHITTNRQSQSEDQEKPFRSSNPFNSSELDKEDNIKLAPEEDNIQLPSPDLIDFSQCPDTNSYKKQEGNGSIQQKEETRSYFGNAIFKPETPKSEDSDEDPSAKRVREYIASLSARLQQQIPESGSPTEMDQSVTVFPLTPPSSDPHFSAQSSLETPPNSSSWSSHILGRFSSTETPPSSAGVYIGTPTYRYSATDTPPNSMSSQHSFTDTPPLSADYASALTGPVIGIHDHVGPIMTEGIHGVSGALRRAMSCDSVSSDTSVTIGDLEEQIGQITGHLSVELIYDNETADLEVVVVEAEDLVGPDPNVAVDSYVRVFLIPDKSTNMQTRVCRRSNNPTYRERFLFALEEDELPDRSLAFYMYASDKFANTLIGEGHLKLSDVDLSSSSPVSTVLTLTDTGQKGIGYGEIMFSLSYLPTAERLTVVIVKARSLQWVDDKDSADPFVKVYILQNEKKLMKRKTGVKKDTRSPVFNEAMIFNIPAPALHNIQLRITVAENSTGGQSNTVGHVIVGTQATGKALSHWNQMMSSLRKPIGMWHPLKR